MKAGSKRRNLFRSNNVTSGDNGNLTPTTQKTGGQALEKSSPKTGQQGLRAFGNFFRRKRNRQVKPATTILPPVSQRVSETPRSTIPSDDGHTNFSPKLTRNVTVTRATIQRTSRSFRLTLLLMVVTIVFILSWIPPFVAMVWFFHVGYATPPKSYEIALRNYGSTGYILNHFANPIIYIALSSSFRENVSSLWRSLTSRFR
ncbi:uncharacterized protein LOC143274948 [Babylonia areolata]|uniref:uncharacterized protein LOC143274948 n=1 Tax=Babylonia areolata TaxID=304850 RepID=UPI003FD036ED